MDTMCYTDSMRRIECALQMIDGMCYYGSDDVIGAEQSMDTVAHHMYD